MVAIVFPPRLAVQIQFHSKPYGTVCKTSNYTGELKLILHLFRSVVLTYTVVSSTTESVTMTIIRLPKNAGFAIQGEMSG